MRCIRAGQILCLTFLAFGLVACGSGHGNDGDIASAAEFPKSIYERADCSEAPNSNPGIIGGESVRADSWLAETVVMLKHNSNVDGDGSLCTATLIDQNIIITAAHCVSDEDTRAPFAISSLQVFFDPNPLCDHGAFPKRTVEQVLIHPAWLQKSGGATDRGDVAILRLSGVSPESYRNSDLSAPVRSPEASILSAGFGSNFFIEDPYSAFRLKYVQPMLLVDPSVLGELARAQYSLDFPNDGSARGSPDSSMDFKMKMELQRYDARGGGEFLTLDQRQGKGICTGDSGGPLFETVAGRHSIIGIASYVMGPQTQDENGSTSLCSKFGVYSSIHHYASWIRESFSQLRNAQSLRTTPFAN